MFFTDANTTAAIFLSANSKSDHAMSQSQSSMTAGTEDLMADVLYSNFSPLHNKKFYFPIPDGPYTVDHFKDLPDEWMDEI